jgi:hypothetical protein
LIERREIAKVLLHQESLASIAAGTIALLAILLESCALPACPRGGAHARAAARARGV